MGETITVGHLPRLGLIRLLKDLGLLYSDSKGGN